MTANVFIEDVERCMEAGMTDHIGKPLDFDDVVNKLKKYINPESHPVSS
jgi:CheY-like chemotaxis protein